MLGVALRQMKKQRKTFRLSHPSRIIEDAKVLKKIIFQKPLLNLPVVVAHADLA